MKGYRTYITLLIGVFYNIARIIGFEVPVGQEELDNAVNSLILVIAGVFRYLTTKGKTSQE